MIFQRSTFTTLQNRTSSRNKFRYAVIDGLSKAGNDLEFHGWKVHACDDFEYQRDPTVNLAKLSYQDIAKQYPKIRVKFDSFVLPVVTVNIEGDELELIEDMFSRIE